MNKQKKQKFEKFNELKREYNELNNDLRIKYGFKINSTNYPKFKKLMKLYEMLKKAESELHR